MGSREGTKAGRRQLIRGAAGVWLALALAVPARAGTAAWPETELDLIAAPERSLSLLAEVSILAVLAADRRTEYPDLELLREGEPQLMLGRAGLLGRYEPWELDAIVRADLSEGLRIQRRELRDRPAAALGRMLDDAALRWWPQRSAGVVVGRHAPPFSRFRQVERGALLGSAPPHLLARIAPESRWGVAAIGAAGGVGYAAGAYADTARLELTRPVRDPSREGRAIASTRITWAVRGPSGEPHRPLPSQNPGHEQLRLELGAGAMWRIRDATRGHRLDATASAHAAYRRLAGVLELVAHSERELHGLGFAGEAGVLVGERGVVEVRGELDSELRLWSAGAGATYFATASRRNAVSLYGFVRRPVAGGPARDGLLLELRASL